MLHTQTNVLGLNVWNGKYAEGLFSHTSAPSRPGAGGDLGKTFDYVRDSNWKQTFSFLFRTEGVLEGAADLQEFDLHMQTWGMKKSFSPLSELTGSGGVVVGVGELSQTICVIVKSKTEMEVLSVNTSLPQPQQAHKHFTRTFPSSSGGFAWATATA